MHYSSKPGSRRGSKYLNDKTDDYPICPYCGFSKNVVKAGIRNTKTREVQRYKCKGCQRMFSAESLPGVSYLPKVIAFALSYYNVGHTYEETRNAVKRKLGTNVPIPTIQSWTKRYAGLCTFIPMRKRYDIDPGIIIKGKKLYHQQVYEFKYHDLKLNIAAKTFPSIRTYLRNIVEKDSSSLFISSTTRCSTFKPPRMPSIRSRTIRENNATRMTALATTLARSRVQRHQVVGDFFLRNDSSTIAVEIPVYLFPEEVPEFQIDEPLTGHMDILQFRGSKIHILDYKPDQNLELARDQLHLYGIALGKRTGIPPDMMKTAAFNDISYLDFGPL